MDAAASIATSTADPHAALAFRTMATVDSKTALLTRRSSSDARCPAAIFASAVAISALSAAACVTHRLFTTIAAPLQEKWSQNKLINNPCNAPNYTKVTTAKLDTLPSLP